MISEQFINTQIHPQRTNGSWDGLHLEADDAGGNAAFAQSGPSLLIEDARLRMPASGRLLGSVGVMTPERPSNQTPDGGLWEGAAGCDIGERHFILQGQQQP